MKEVLKFISKYKIYIVLAILFLFCLFLFITFYKYMNPSDLNTVYGSRLDGIENVIISDDKKDEIIKFIKDNEDVSSASIDIQGKIINISIKIGNKENTIDIMKEKCSLIVNKFSKEEIEFYDFQFFIKNEDANYNLIGYKNKKNEELSYSHDVIVSEVEENEEKQ